MKFIGDKIFGVSIRQAKPEAIPMGGEILDQNRVNPADAGKIRYKQNMARMYEAATFNNFNRDFPVTVTSANAEILVSHIATRSRARRLERDFAYAWRGLNIIQNNVGGHDPFRLKIKVGKKVADGSFEEDSEVNDQIKKWWRRTGRPEFYTIRRDMSRREVYWQTITAMVRDGGIIFRDYPGFNNEMGFASEPIEIDRLDHNFNRSATAQQTEVQFGIERDEFHAPIAYHLLTRHPGDVFVGANKPKYREAVPAERVIALFDIRTRAGQYVAVSRFSSVILPMHELRQYNKAERIAATIASCQMGFFIKKLREGEFAGEIETADGEKEITAEPGALWDLSKGEEFQQWSPEHPTSAYPEFAKENKREMASGMGLCYHTMGNDLSSVNYTSSRTGRLEDIKEFKKLQEHIIDNFIRPDFERRLKYAILSGAVKLPMSRWQEFCDAAEFQPERWDLVDPVKDTTAAIMQIEAGLTSRQREVDESNIGADFETICREQAEDIELANSHGLDFETIDTPKIESGIVPEEKPENQPPIDEPKSSAKSSGKKSQRKKSLSRIPHTAMEAAVRAAHNGDH